MQEKEPSFLVPTSSERAVTPLSYQGQFVPRSDLTYKAVVNVGLSDASLHQSLLTGALLRGSRFTRVDFSRCDFDGVRIEHCEFIECDFRNIDIRSAVVTETAFARCHFDGSLHNDCTYSKVTFDRCSLRETAFSESLLLSGEWNGCELTGSSFIRNDFRGVSIKSTALADCTFLYMIMTSCTFQDVRVNIESLGMIYGLSSEALREMQFTYLGTQGGKSDAADLVNALISEYDSRGWSLGSAILKLNFHREAPLYVLRSYLSTLTMWAADRKAVRKDDLLFIGKVMQELADEDRLPLLSCVDAVEAATEMSRVLSDQGSHHLFDSTLRSFGAAVSALGHDLIDQLDWDGSNFAVHSSERIEFRLLFHERPAVVLTELCGTLSSALGLQGETRLIGSRAGSYQELVATTLGTAVALQVFLIIINGTLAQVTEVKARWQILRRKRLPKSFVDRALVPGQTLNVQLADIMQRVIRQSAEFGWLKTPHLGGVNGDNLVNLEMKELDGEQPPT